MRSADGFSFPVDPVSAFREFGFAVLKMFDREQVDVMSRYSENWLNGLLEPWTKGDAQAYPLSQYHRWGKTLGVDHGSIFKAAQRHTVPPPELHSMLLNDSLKSLISSLGISGYSLWDEGLGWLAFRFIRPGSGDGYPFSCKAWGPAKRVLSVWVPIIGHSELQTLKMVPGSHLREYSHFLPTDGKFRADEYRLSSEPEARECYSPAMKPGEAIVFDPRLLHTEEVKSGEITRFSLEYRVSPENQNWLG